MIAEVSVLNSNPDRVRALLAALRDALGEHAVMTGSDISEAYTHDWARDRVGSALAVLRPKSTEEVSRACALCTEAGVGIVPQGGHTGLVGGAQQNASPCILLSTARMSRIEEIDADNMTCSVQTGVVLEALQTDLAERDLEFGVAIGAQGSAQIGGLISTNAGGLRVVRHGMMAAQVLGLEMVLADGRIVSSMSGLHKDNRGPDPMRLAIGAEGAFGVITRACLRVLPRQRQSATAWVGCPSMDAALGLLRHVRQAGHEVLAAFEVMSQACMPLAQLADSRLLPPLEAQIHVLIEFSSAMELPLKLHLQDVLAEALEQSLAEDAVIAQSNAQSALFWRIREGLVEGHAKRGFHVRSDVSVRLGRLPEAAKRLESMLTGEFPGWIPQSYGHMGDGNLHFNALPPDGLQEADARTIGKEIETRIFETITELDGSFSAEHGIGRSKARWFRETMPDRHDVLSRLKAALDPQGVMNPGCLLTEAEETS